MSMWTKLKLTTLCVAGGLLMTAPGQPVQQAGEKRRTTSIHGALLGEQRAAATAMVWTCFLLALIASYLLLSWLPTLLVSRGLSRQDASIVQLGYNLAGMFRSAALSLRAAPLGRYM